MKNLLIFTFVLIIPFSIFAQNWTPEQQEVIDQIKRDWDSWVEAVKQKDLDIWKKECQPMDDWLGWWVDKGSLRSNESRDRTFAQRAKNTKDCFWETIQPLSVKIYDKVAVIYFYVIFNSKSIDDTWTRVEQKRIEVLRKVSGKWRIADAMVSTEKLD